MDSRNNDGTTPMCVAAEKGYLEIVKYLIENGANANATDVDGKTALTWAVEKGHSEVVKFLNETRN